MTHKEIEEKVIKLVSVAVSDSREVQPKDTLKYDLDLDSLDIVELAINCELEFEITIPDKELADVVTVQSIIDLVIKLRENN